MPSETDLFIRKWVDAHKQRDIKAIRSLISEDAKFYDVGSGLPLVGFEAYRTSVEQLWKSFPDLRSTIEETITTPNRVVVRWIDHYTHAGEFFGVPASGRAVEQKGCTVFKLEGGKASEVHTYSDFLSLQRQLFPQNHSASVRYTVAGD